MDIGTAPARSDADIADLIRVTDLVPAPVWVSSGLDGVNWANRAMTEFTGRPAADYDGNGWTEGIHPDDVDGYVALCHAKWAAKEPYEVVYRLRRADGQWRWVMNRAVPFAGAGGGYIGVSIDITDQVRLVEQVEGERSRLSMLVAVLSELVGALTEDLDDTLRSVIARIGGFVDVDRVGLVRIDHERRTMELDWAWHSSRITEDFAVERSIALDSHPDVARRLEAQQIVCIDDVHAMPDAQAVDREMLRSRGIRSNAVVPIVLGGTVTGLLFLDDHHGPRDWGQLLPTLQVLGHALASALGRREADATLRHQAFHDALTGLPNRTVIDRHAARAVILLDLDGFKMFNDSLGHSAGDRLLVEVSQRIRATVDGTHTVARLGGDEFAVIVDGPDADDVARTVAGRIEQAFAEPFELDGREVVVTASIGISHANAIDRGADVLLRNADLAMFAAKDAGRGRTVEFDAQLERMAHERLVLQTDLRRALTRGEIVVHYQPSFDLRTRRVTSVEALVRWRHPTLGLVPPGRFLPLVEDQPIIEQLGERVLDLACRQSRDWVDALGWSPSVAVNVAPRQLANPEFVGAVAATIARQGMQPERLVLEITERSLLDDATSLERLAALRATGVKLAVDDFGTGYSSLGYLRDLPVDILKIDRSFVVAMDDGDRRSVALVAMIVELARVLELTTVAEGIEDEEHAAILRRLGCDIGQGYLFARPQPADDLLDLLREHAPQRR